MKKSVSFVDRFTSDWAAVTPHTSHTMVIVESRCSRVRIPKRMSTPSAPESETAALGLSTEAPL
jgi:hypothetical protein